jgi:hypothetical protein
MELEDLEKRVKELDDNGLKVQQQISALSTLLVENQGRKKELQKLIEELKKEEETENGKAE